MSSCAARDLGRRGGGAAARMVSLAKDAVVVDWCRFLGEETRPIPFQSFSLKGIAMPIERERNSGLGPLYCRMFSIEVGFQVEKMHLKTRVVMW